MSRSPHFFYIESNYKNNKQKHLYSFHFSLSYLAIAISYCQAQNLQRCAAVSFFFLEALAASKPLLLGFQSRPGHIFWKCADTSKAFCYWGWVSPRPYSFGVKRIGEETAIQWVSPLNWQQVRFANLWGICPAGGEHLGH